MSATPPRSEARRSAEQSALALARRELAGSEVWLVGGIVRDRLVARPARFSSALAEQGGDIDLAVAGDAGKIARRLARAGPGSAFALSEQFGSWRVIARDRSWQIDVEPLRGPDIEQDLKLRDLSVNAIAERLADGELLDPLGGVADLRQRRLRAVAERAFADDPLRVLRLARQACDLGFQIEPQTISLAIAAAPALSAVAPERIFAELKLLLGGPDPVVGLRLAERLGALAVALPELLDLHGVQQSRYHHLDAFDHTLAVVEQVVQLGETLLAAGADPAPIEQAGAPVGVASAPPAASAGGAADESGGGAALLSRLDQSGRRALATLLLRPAGDGLSGLGALRFGALLHDIAKPQTRRRLLNGGIGFPGHELLGAEMAGTIARRWRASGRLGADLAALVRGHLRLGFLVHEPQPLARRTLYAYLRAGGALAVEITLLSVADRLATAGARSEQAIAAHLALAADTLPATLRWSQEGPPRPLLRGDELAVELALPRDRHIGELLEELRAAQYAGEVADRAGALAHARASLASGQDGA